MINTRIDQKSFLGNPDKVLGNVLAYIEEVKSTFESEVFKGLGFGLIFYHLHADGGDVVVLSSNQIVQELVSFKSRPPLILSEQSEQWNKALNILRDWKYVEPSFITHGWKDKHSFAFSHSMAIPTMAAGDSTSPASKVVECHIFKSLHPNLLPFVLIDGLLAPPRGNALCVVEAAPEEELLYSRLKNRSEEEQQVKLHFVRALLKSKRPAVLLKAFKCLGQMRCGEELFEAAVEVCLENLPGGGDRMLSAMEKALFSVRFPTSQKLATLIRETLGNRIELYLNDREPSRRRLAARFYFAAEDQPDANIIQKLARDQDFSVRQLTAEQLAGRTEAESLRAILFELLQDTSSEVRLKAVKVLASQPDELTFRRLFALTADPDVNVRAAVVGAFAHESASPWVESLIEMLQDSHGEVFRAAAKALRYAAREKHLPSIKTAYQRLKSNSQANGALVELEWTILALEGNICELEKMQESYGAKFSRMWISPVIRRAREIEQNRHQTALNGI